MPRNFQKWGEAHLARQMSAHASSPITYWRGPESVSLLATFGEKLLRQDDGGGGTFLVWTDIDFIFPAADLVLGGVRVEPKDGDEVRVDEHADPDDETSPVIATRVYEVAPIGNDPSWRYSGPYRYLVRVHAKFIEVTPATGGA